MNKQQFLQHSIYSTKIIDKRINIDNILMEFGDNKNNYKFTHFINKRWENIYLNINEIPSIKPLLSLSTSYAIEVFRKIIKPHQTLMIPNTLLGYEKNEFWFNAASKGESTDTHNHINKAAVSGVFYLQAPQNSANLFFKEDKEEMEVKAETNKLILFPAELDHYVPENKSNKKRISIAFNLYRFPLTI